MSLKKEGIYNKRKQLSLLNTDIYRLSEISRKKQFPCEGRYLAGLSIWRI